MSHPYYDQLWRGAQRDLKQSLDTDARIRKNGPNPNAEQAKWLVSHLYMSYVSVVNRLDQCYDQIVHPQKREVIGRLLDTTMGRVLEIKQDIVRLELDDYNYFDNILMELKLTHHDMEIKVPACFRRDREKATARRRELIKEAIEEVRLEEFKREYLKNVPEEEQEEVWALYEEEQQQERIKEEKEKERLRRRPGYVSPPPERVLRPGELTIPTAITIIQRHERARQSRVAIHGKFGAITLLKRMPEQLSHVAAVVIQRHWRRHWRRVLEKRRSDRRLQLLGIHQPSWKDKSIYSEMEAITQRRRALQDKNQEEYEAAQLEVKLRVTQRYTPHMSEDTSDEIRFWFEDFFNKTETLPTFPPPFPLVPTGEIYGLPKGIKPEFVAKTFPNVVKQTLPSTQIGRALAGMKEMQGTALVVAGHWLTPEQYNMCKKELDNLKKNKSNKEKAPKPTKEELAEKKKKEKERLKRLEAAEEAKGFQMKPSNFHTPLNKANHDYRTMWADLDETNNMEQRYIKALVHEDKCYELSVEVRQVVDELMWLELELLDLALQKDRNPKKKPKKRKRPKPKKKKQKKIKDPTANVPMEELFKELYINNVIRDYEEAYLRDYFGDKSLSAFEYRARFQDPLPAPGDVRETVLHNCILPLGSSRVHQLLPLVKSVCLLGPENGGKEFLARIICTETASVMFDLTPSNIQGKYPAKKDLKRLQHLVEKMSRLLQPSVIFIHGAERIFYKKVPKPERQTNPKRLKGALPKLVKGVTTANQVLVLGTSSYPWLCPRKKLIKNYQKILYVPRPDYGTYFKLWQTLLLPYHSLPREFDFSALAKVSAGYSVKVIMDIIRTVLNGEKMCRNRQRPYKEADFMEELCKINPTPEVMEKKCLNFMLKTEMGKKKAEGLDVIRKATEKNKKKK